MKIGIVGCGGIGMMHAKALRVLSKIADVEVTAIADGRKQCRDKVKELWQKAEEYEGAAELIREADAACIYICLPSYLHTEYAAAAMNAGKNVFIEKPLCLKEEEAALLLQTQKETGREVMVGQVVRWFPEYRFLKRIYREGTYGRLKSVTMSRICGRPQWSFENWFVDLKKSGSVVMDLHIHDLDFLRNMLGEPDQVTVRGTKFEDGMPNQVLTVLDYPDTFAVAEGCWDVSAALPFQSCYRACFERATAEFDANREQPLIIFHKDGRTEEIKMEAEDIPCDKTGINISDVRPYFEEDRYFMNCLMAGKRVEKANLTDAAASVRLGISVLSQVLKNGR